MSYQVVSYELDNSQRIIRVGHEFEAFLQQNQGRSSSQDLLGSSLWSAVSGRLVQRALRHLLELSDEAPLEVFMRCDSPAQLRLWKLRIESTGTGHHLTFSELQRQIRPRSAPRTPRKPRLPLCFCSWCNRGGQAGDLPRELDFYEMEYLMGQMVVAPSAVQHLLCEECEKLLEAPPEGAVTHMVAPFTSRQSPQGLE